MYSLLAFLLRLSATARTEIHLISLPRKALGVGICLRWSQLPQFEPADVTPSSEEVFIHSPSDYSTESSETATEATGGPQNVSWDALFISGSSDNFSSELSSSTVPQTSPSPATTDSPIGDAPKRKGVKGRRKFLRTTTAGPRVPFTFGDIQPNDQPFSLKESRKGKYRNFGGHPNEIQSDEGYAGDGESVDETFEGCWAVDNILIINMAHLPAAMEERFDPIDPSQWLFFPGAHVQVN